MPSSASRFASAASENAYLLLTMGFSLHPLDSAGVVQSFAVKTKMAMLQELIRRRIKAQKREKVLRESCVGAVGGN